MSEKYNKLEMLTTVKYYFKDFLEEIKKNPPKSDNKTICEVKVLPTDCISAGALYKNAVIHNFANNTRPGGPTSVFSEDGKLMSQHKNSSTQEDQIIRFYKTDLLLPACFYPICDESKENGEALLYSTGGSNKPVISLAAPINPNFKKQKIINTVLNRMKLMLYVAHKHNHTLITGLWGAGAFSGNTPWGLLTPAGNNPWGLLTPQAGNTYDIVEIVELWKFVIKSTPYLPERIVFAIIVDKYSEKWGKAEDIIKLFESINN